MFSTQLAKRAAENNPIRVGIIGAGKFGAGLVAQISQMQGMVASAIADIDLEHATGAYEASNIPSDAIQRIGNVDAMDDAIRRGKPAITEDGQHIIQSDLIDVVVEATGIPEVGARMAYHTLMHKKHLVMVNVETDVTIGPFLRRLADNAGVVYTLVDGDQPGVTMNIVDWSKTLGFEIVAAGRGTVFYDDDRIGIPDTVPQRFGAKVFSLQGEGGILNRHGVVDLANSVATDGKSMLDNPLRMGVFVVIRTDHPFTQEDLAGYNLYPGDNGRNYLLYRPYHLVAVEAPISIAKAALYGQPTGTPLPTPVADVITVAKRDLKAGDVLDGSGGYAVNGLIEKAEIARAENLLPLGLAYDVKLKRDISQGEAISYDMVELNEDSFVLKLRRLQDATV